MVSSYHQSLGRAIEYRHEREREREQGQMRRFCPECQDLRPVEDNGERDRSLHYALLCLSCGAQWEPNQI